MEIKINDKESYNIKFEDKISSIEFLGLMDRLNEIKKIIEKSVNFKTEIGNAVMKTGKKGNRRGRGITSLYKTDEDRLMFIRRWESNIDRDELKREVAERLNWDIEKARESIPKVVNYFKQKMQKNGTNI